jgi:hypothetical protein
MPQPNTVDQYLRRLDHPLVPLLQRIRETILDTSPEIAECIKWNSPSFYLREGAKDFATLNLHPRNKPAQYALLILHQGAKVKATAQPAISDPAHLLQWLGKDRCSLKIPDLPTLQAQQTHLQDLLRQWIAHL